MHTPKRHLLTAALAALAPLDDSMLTRTVYIRAQPLTVIQALHRSLAHTAGHAFQIVYLAKSLRGEAMLDVIFNGSGARKSGGMAVVVLVFPPTFAFA